MTESAFSRNYAAARAAFRLAAERAGAQLDSYAYPERGPEGEQLSTDVAWIGPTDATHVFVTVSGTHGVEGFCGSAAQVDWLNRGEAKRLEPTFATLLIHAINPFGFAWLRRVTHENVDLNRNWIDFSAPLPQRPAYDEIASELCPTTWTAESQAQTMAYLQKYMATRGKDELVKAVTVGQYHHPQGLFFGGTAPTLARKTLERIFGQHLSRAQHVGIIDYHSGLGPLGYGESMTSARRGSDGYKRMCKWYGAAVVPIGEDDSASAAIGGDWLSAAPASLPHAQVTGIALEFGTVDPLLVLNALRADNWLHAHDDPHAAWPSPIKKQLLDAFYIDSDLWRGMVLGQSLSACRQAVAGLKLAS